MVKDCPEARRAVDAPVADPPVPMVETDPVVAALAADWSVRRARSRPPVATEPTRMGGGWAGARGVP
eukprot:9965145-Prorocentrum_lima.AAC.1